MLRSFYKAPNDVLDYEIDWSAWLKGDPIASHTVTVPAGLTLKSSSASATAVTVWLAGAEAGVAYEVRCRIKTAAGREVERALTIIGR